MIPINYAQLAEFALPEIIVSATALIVLVVDIFILRMHQMRVRFIVAAALASTGCVGAILQMVLAPARASILDGMLVASPLTQLVQIVVLILAILTLLLSV
ncbi:MAG TPA: NADH-quinone oxidoreductase subunit N, partial [Edaphobacter sp.]